MLGDVETEADGCSGISIFHSLVPNYYIREYMIFNPSVASCIPEFDPTTPHA